MGRDYPDKAAGALAASLVDQAILSAATFGVAALFIAFSSKSEFAIYSLIWASIQLASSVQNALILTPFLANIAYLKGAARDQFLNMMGKLELLGSVAGGVIAALAAWIATAVSGNSDLVLASATGLALIGAWAREYRRTRLFADLQPIRVLRGDTTYLVLLTLLLGLGCFIQQTLTASWALGAWGAAGLLTGLDRHYWAKSPVTVISTWRKTLLEQTRWTLPSVVLSWIQGNAYNFTALALVGIHSVADINTARLFSSPLSLLQGGWNRVFLPSAAARVAGGERGEAVRLGAVGVMILAILTVIYGAALFALLSFWRPSNPRFQVTGLGTLCLLWLIYQFVSGARGIGTSLMVVEASFFHLFWFGFGAVVVTLASMFPLGSMSHMNGLLIAMVLGEVVLGSLIWRRVVFGSTARMQAGTMGATASPSRVGEPSL